MFGTAAKKNNGTGWRRYANTHRDPSPLTVHVAELLVSTQVFTNTSADRVAERGRIKAQMYSRSVVGCMITSGVYANRSTVRFVEQP